MKKLIALFTAAVCILSISLFAFAATPTNIVGHLVDGDGKIAEDNYNTIRPGSDYYYVIGPSSEYSSLVNKDYLRFSLKKETNGKYISDANLVEKRFGNTRYVCIQFSVKDNFTADEYKVELQAQFRAKKDLVAIAGTNNSFPTFRLATDADKGGSTELANAKAKLETLRGELTTAQNAYNSAKTALTSLAQVNGQSWTEANMDTLLAQLKALEDQQSQITQQVQQAQTRLQEIATEKSRLDGIAKDAKSPYDAAKALSDAMAARLAQLDAIKTALATYNTAQEEANWTALANAVAAYRDANGNQYVDANGAPISFPAVLPAFADKDTDPTNAFASLTAQLAETEGTEYWNVKNAAAGLAGDASSKETAYNNAQSDADTYAASVKEEETRLNTLITQGSAKNGALSYADAEKTVNNVKSTKSAYDAKQTEFKNQEAAVNRLQTIGGTNNPGLLKSGQTFYHNFKIWIQNENRVDDDATFVAGEKGVVIKPVKNERNTVTWENNNDTIARMTFTADSETEYYCPRLSTKWDSRYNNLFKNVDAYLFDFVGNPRIPATTRATVELFNPFVNRDGDLTVSLSKIRVYEVNADGDLINRTDEFTIGENEDGDQVLTFRTRTLGTYIVAAGKASGTTSKPSGGTSGNTGSTGSTSKPVTSIPNKTNPPTGF